MPINDYNCVDHGVFESEGPHCPHCGKKCEVIHLRAPAVGRKTAQFVDGMVGRLLGEFGLSDVPKQSDAREPSSDVKRLRSSASQPLPQPAQVVNFDVNKNLPSLAEASRPGNEVLNSMRRGHSNKHPPIAMAISDKR